MKTEEAERQGRAAYAKGLPFNPTWPTPFRAGYERAAAEDGLDFTAATAALREYQTAGGTSLEDMERDT